MTRRLIALACLFALVLATGAAPAAATQGQQAGAAVAKNDAASTSSASIDLAAKKASLRAPNEPFDAGSASEHIAEGAIAVAINAPVYRVHDTRADSVIYTTNLSEFPDGDDYHYDGIAFYCKPATDTMNVYRLRHIATGTYRYAQGEDDRDYVLATYPGQFEDQGVSFTRDGNWMVDESEIYQFNRGSQGENFYTADPDEKYLLQMDSHNYSYQGIAFYSITGCVDGTGAISGTVSNGSGPLAGMKVYATGATGTWLGQTAANGSYTIYNLPAGDYQVSFSTWPHAGETSWKLAPEFYNDAHTRSAAAVVSVAEGVTTPDINATLEEIVPDPSSGDLFPVYRLSDKYNGTLFFTDDWTEVLDYTTYLGEYYQYDGAMFFYDDSIDTVDVHRFYNLANDTYFYTASEAEKAYIMAAYPMFQYEGVCFKASPGTGLPVHRFYRRYWGDHFYTADTAEYDALRADTSGEWSYEGVAFSVSGPARFGTGTGSISGTVTGPDNAPLSGLWVRAAKEDADYSYGTWLGRTNASGQYTIGNLPAGEYVLSFDIWPYSNDDGYPYQPEYYSNTHSFSSYSPVVVASTNVPSINAKLEWFPQPVYRFYNSGAGTHFYTANQEEMLSICENLSHIFTFEGPAYYRDPAKNVQPLHRFFHKSNHTHFYTANEDEKASIIANLSHIYQYEGPAYNVSSDSGGGTKTTVYRFYHRSNGTHFYTASEAERDYVINSLSQVYGYEGPAFWIGQ